MGTGEAKADSTDGQYTRYNPVSGSECREIPKRRKSISKGRLGDQAMGKKPLNVQIDEELYNFIKQKAEEKGRSLREIIEELIKDYKQPRPKTLAKGIVLGKEQHVILKEESQCALCGRKLYPGYHVVFYENLGHVCLKCYYRKMYNKALADKYLKVKELQETIKQLKKRADELALEVEKLEAVKNIDGIISRIEQVVRSIEDAKMYPNLWNEKYEELMDTLLEIEEMLLGMIWVYYHQLKELGIKFDRYNVKRKIKEIEYRINKLNPELTP